MKWRRTKNEIAIVIQLTQCSLLKDNKYPKGSSLDDGQNSKVSHQLKSLAVSHRAYGPGHDELVGGADRE